MTRWRGLAEEWCGADALPTHPDLGARYPWRAVWAHGLTREHRRRVEKSLSIIDEALSMGIEWRAGISCGKDSTAMALLLGSRVRWMSVKDDLDYPGERRYADALAARCGAELDVLTPPRSLRAFLVEEGVSLVDDLHGRAAALSSTWFYGLIDEYQRAEGYGGAMLGLRRDESHGRKMNLISRGPLYQRKSDGLWMCNPLAWWRTIDVHAALLHGAAPLLPVYLCIEPGADWADIRKSWWVAGGAASDIGGHYSWLRRWWPELWDQAVGIDPRVSAVS